mmetsp:Transcript_33609/g.79572  ORF Transcript_33609/g.79572 Transcript_33609/m.79572 type:complete len:208 (-) Transcript_33609:595-1218(-)
MTERPCPRSTLTSTALESLSTTRSSRNMNATRGTRARTPEMVSMYGVCCAHAPASPSPPGTMSISAEVLFPPDGFDAPLCGICSGKKRVRRRTKLTGMRDANVTTPKPVRGDGLCPACATPTPRAMTSGTVTGPVVTAPRSHARPRTSARSVKSATAPENASVIATRMTAGFFRPTPQRIRSMPREALSPTPAATASTNKSWPSWRR